MLHCNSCSNMLIRLKYCNTNLIFKNSKKQVLRLVRLLHITNLKDSIYSHKVKKSLEFDTEKEPIPNFINMMDFRRKQAMNSVVVQVKSDSSFSQFNDFCSKLDNINNIYSYVLPDSKLCFSLVEFSDNEVLSEIQLGCRKSNFELVGLPCFSPFLLFHHTPEFVKNVLNKSKNSSAVVKDFGVLPSEQQIAKYLTEMETVSDQILKLFELTKVNDLGIRLRFLTACQIESALCGIFPGSQCLLFGSSVNGCGRLNSDLDLVLNFNGDSKISTSNGQLVFQEKKKFINERARLQKHMEILADFIHNFLPGCYNVIRILQARVPIIKYKHEYTGIDCDLSLTNNNAVTMSKLLYTLSSVDWRVRPLLLTVKHWAEKANVTNPFPGHWVSNFSLSLLVLFYLQQIKMIPNIDHIVLLKRANEQEFDSEVTFTFLNDVIQSFIDKNQVKTSLSEIFYGFFEYYLKFDFDSNGISLNTGQILCKRSTDEAMYIVNPLDQQLNVSKNVSLQEINNLKIKLTEAIDLLSSQLKQGKDDSSEWGIIPLIKGSTLQKKTFSFFNSKTQAKRRLVNVSELFSDS